MYSSPAIDRLTNQVTKREWINPRPYDPDSTYWKSDDYLDFRRLFHRAVEAQFDWFIDIQCKKTGLEKHEYVAIFFGLGQAPMDIKTAEEVCVFFGNPILLLSYQP